MSLQGFSTGGNWRKLDIKLCASEHKGEVCLDGEKILEFEISSKWPVLPSQVCVAVCAGCTGGAKAKGFRANVDLTQSDQEAHMKKLTSTISAISVNKIQVESVAKNLWFSNKVESIAASVGIPEGCKDWKFDGGKLVISEKEEIWRTAGDVVVHFGFELTQDKDNKEYEVTKPPSVRCS